MPGDLACTVMTGSLFGQGWEAALCKASLIYIHLKAPLCPSLAHGLRIKFRLRFHASKDFDGISSICFPYFYACAADRFGDRGRHRGCLFLFEREVACSPVPVDNEHVAESHLVGHAQVR